MVRIRVIGISLFALSMQTIFASTSLFGQNSKDVKGSFSLCNMQHLNSTVSRIFLLDSDSIRTEEVTVKDNEKFVLSAKHMQNKWLMYHNYMGHEIIVLLDTIVDEKREIRLCKDQNKYEKEESFLTEITGENSLIIAFETDGCLSDYSESIQIRLVEPGSYKVTYTNRDNIANSIYVSGAQLDPFYTFEQGLWNLRLSKTVGCTTHRKYKLTVGNSTCRAVDLGCFWNGWPQLITTWKLFKIE